MRFLPRSLVVCVAALAALLHAAPARGGEGGGGLSVGPGRVTVEVRNGDRVTGTISPTSNVENVCALLPAGARLTVTVTGLRKGTKPAPVVTFRVVDPDDNEVVSLRPTQGAGAKLNGFRIATSGVHRIEVTPKGTRTGDYLLTVAWTSRRTFPIAGIFVGSPSPVPFDADLGARVSILVEAARGSPARPRIVRVHDGPDAFERTFAAPADAAVRHRVAGITVPGGGLVVDVGDLDGSGGKVKGSITVTPPAPVRRNLVLTDAKLGGGKDGIVKGAVVATTGGTVTFEGAENDISGAAVDVPAGALKLPSAIYVGTGKSVTAGAGRRAIGPAVLFGPEGLAFAAGKPAAITLPFDPATAGDASNVQVRVRDAAGKVRTLSLGGDPAVDLVKGRVTFQAQHFSTYQVFTTAPAPKIPGDLDDDGFGDLVIPAAARNSETGRVYVFRGGPSIASEPSSGADLTLDGAGAGDEFGRAFLVADLNGDGTDDLAVSGRTPHRVSIWFGGPTFLAGGSPDVTLTAASADANFGIRLATADLGGDTTTDLVVGDEDSTKTAATAGAVFVFFGPITSDELSSAADAVIAGEATGDLFGAAVATGDVLAPATGPDDDRADLVVGADQADNPGSGKVYVFRGPLGGARDASTADAILSGEASGDGFGLQIAVADIDDGGRADVIAASAEFDLPGPTSSVGKVYAFRGEDGVATGSASAAQMSFTGVIAGDRLGSSLTAGDVFGGSLAEVFVGIGGWTIPGTSAGAVTVVFEGFTTEAVSTRLRFEGTSGARVGQFALPPTDVNGDGRPDAILVGFEDQTGGLRAGAVFIFFGGSTPGSSPQPVTGADVIITGAPDEYLGGRD